MGAGGAGNSLVPLLGGAVCRIKCPEVSRDGGGVCNHCEKRGVGSVGGVSGVGSVGSVGGVGGGSGVGGVGSVGGGSGGSGVGGVGGGSGVGGVGSVAIIRRQSKSCRCMSCTRASGWGGRLKTVVFQGWGIGSLFCFVLFLFLFLLL